MIFVDTGAWFAAVVPWDANQPAASGWLAACAEPLVAGRVCWLWQVTAAQDKRIRENNQRGILSSRYEPGPYATTESSVEAFVTWYVNELGRPDLDPVMTELDRIAERCGGGK